jgi:ribose 5-phosphate isomerase A
MDREAAKRAAGEAAAALVEAGMSVGLGTGSTALWFTLALAERARGGLQVRIVATSSETEALAIAHGLQPLGSEWRGLDLAVDGADCVDPDLRLIKGAGGAMVRERIVGAAAKRFVIVVDESKLSDRLRGRVPVELLSFGAEHTLASLDATGARYALRADASGRARISDNGNLLADGEYESIEDPEGLSARLDSVPGVVGHGLFLGMADLVMVGRTDGTVQHLTPR